MHGENLKSIEYSSSWKATIYSDSPEIPRILRNPEADYRSDKRPQPVPILSNINTVHVSQSHLLKIRFNIIPHLLLGLPSGPFLQFPPNSSMYIPHALPISFISVWSPENNISWAVQIIKLLIM